MITDSELNAMCAAYVAGKVAAQEMLHVGNVFLGAFNVADSLGYARESLDWRSAVLGAKRAIAAFGQVWLDADGCIVPAPDKIKLSQWGFGGQAQ